MKPVQVKKVENVSVCILQVVRCLMSMSQVPVINDNVFFIELYFLPAARHPSCLDLPAYYADKKRCPASILPQTQKSENYSLHVVGPGTVQHFGTTTYTIMEMGRLGGTMDMSFMTTMYCKPCPGLTCTHECLFKLCI